MLGLQRLDQAASSRNKLRQFDVLLTVTAPHERIIFIATAFLMLALLAWAVFGRIQHDVMIDGVLIEPGERHEVTSTEPGHLLEYFALPGDRVAAGGRVARQSVPELDREVAELRRRLGVVGGEAKEMLQDDPQSPAFLEETRVALMALEARRAARETIVSHVAGEVTELRAAPGEFVAAGKPVARVRSGGDAEAGPVHAVLRVGPDIARRVRPGMPATVEVTMPGGGTQRLEGEVVSVVGGSLPEWLASVPPAAVEGLHRIDVRLRQAPDGSVPDGTACRVRLVLGEGSPASLLVPRML